ncbi:MAG: N-acetylmuramoyl-L-alanine amidase [Clostridia bacterium]|nr:N-acetylmuramoyl-L-alanine amidase [Clostridia bacterium]
MKKSVSAALSLLVLLTVICSAVVFARKKARTVLTSASAGLSLPVIVLDAGHGGFDGGATATDGTPEKDFNLAIALKLRDCLELMGFQVIMTRTDDTGTEDEGLQTIREKKVSDIHNRMDMMENAGECIFVSIHQNFFADASCHGTQVFYSGNDPRSEAMAKLIQSDIAALLQPENTRQIKRSGDSIYLLYHAKKPAVLIECGFISNTDDVSHLKDATYQQQLSFCIGNALLNYFNPTEADNGAEK